MILNALLEALKGTRKQVIAVIPSEELKGLREVVKAQMLNQVNGKAATLEHYFNYVLPISADRFVTEHEKIRQEIKHSFFESGRSRLIEAEFNRLKGEKERLFMAVLAAHGIDYTDSIELDVATGEVTRERGGG